MKKIILTTTLLLLLVIIIIATSRKKTGSFNQSCRIAVCPTFYNKANKLGPEEADIIYTKSTAEGLDLLQQEKVDYVLSGRTPLPGENFNYQALEDYSESYSFLASRTITIFTNDFDDYDFYTDLSENKIRKDLNINNINRVDNIYDYLDQGILISSWDNSNFYQANIVHVLNSDGSRVRKSRLAGIHYLENCDDNIILKIKKIINNNLYD